MLPAEISTGTYEVKELNSGPGHIVLSSLTTGGSRDGRASGNLPTCCGFYQPGWNPDYVDTTIDGSFFFDVMATDSCTDQQVDIANGINDWYSSNNGIVQVTYKQVRGVAAGTTTGNACGWLYEGSGTNCSLQQICASAPVTVQQLGSFDIVVSSTPVQGETNSVVSNQSAQITVTAFDTTGATMTSYVGTVKFSSTDTTATLPANYTFTSADAGVHTFNVTLKTVSGTGPMRDLTVTDSTANVSSTQNIFVWWYVFMDVEFWKNCNFVSCPNAGSYFCKTAYKSGGYSQQTSFLAVTNSSSSLYNQAVTVRNGNSRSTSLIGDAGPVLNQPYWNTGNTPPSIAGCLSDVLMTEVGIANGCHNGSSYGSGTIYWRFGN